MPAPNAKICRENTVSRPQGLSCVISDLTETSELWGEVHSEIKFVIHGMQGFLGASPIPLTICGQLFHLVSFSDEVIFSLNQMLIYWETITMFDQRERSSRCCGLALIPKIGGILKNSFKTLCCKSTQNTLLRGKFTELCYCATVPHYIPIQNCAHSHATACTRNARPLYYTAPSVLGWTVLY